MTEVTPATPQEFAEFGNSLTAATRYMRCHDPEGWAQAMVDPESWAKDMDDLEAKLKEVEAVEATRSNWVKGVSGT